MSDEGRAGGPPAPRDAVRERIRELHDELRRQRADVEQLAATLERRQRALDAIETSAGWRLILRFRRERDRLVERSAAVRRTWGLAARVVDRVLGRKREPPAPPRPPDDAYARWVARHAPSPARLEELRRVADRLAVHPMFTLRVGTRTAGTVAEPGDAAHLRATLASISAQTWTRWRVAVDAPPDAADGARVALAALGFDADRARLAVPGDAVSAGVAAEDEWVAFVPAGDELAPDALHELAVAIEADPDADLVYTDEDLLLEGRRADPLFKPDWSPDLLLSMNYLGQLTVYRRAVLEAVTTPDTAPGPGRDWDLVLRCTERARRVVHVPAVLYHARDARRLPGIGGPRADDPGEGERVLREAVTRRRIDAVVEPARFPVHRVRRAIAGQPLVSIVMPTRDKGDVLRRCVESIEARSTWPRRELVVVDNGSADPATLRYLDDLERRHRVLRDAGPFNWSRINNAAAREARGSVLLFMNNDMEVLAPGWIEAMLEHAQRDEVGAVGAKLLYPDGTIQHGGVVLGIGVAGHAFKHLPDAEPGYAWLPHAVRDVSAVTGACLMVRRETFERLGGFDERLPVAFNDVDFCLRLRAEGRLVVYTPFAVLTHHESATRGPLHPREDDALAFSRWRPVLGRDPYYNPNLTRHADDWTLGA